MNPMFNEYKDAGKIQEALLIGRNMVNKAPGDSECVNAYLDLLLMLTEKLPRTDERRVLQIKQILFSLFMKKMQILRMTSSTTFMCTIIDLVQ